MTNDNIIQQAKKVIDEAVEGLKNAASDNPVNITIEHNAKDFKWDYPITAEIPFFDAHLSYEISGYRPITKTEGLDFKPEWFTTARDTYVQSGHYTTFRKGTKGYNDYWHEQYKRCRRGYTVNGYTVTGEHYFFLNFYQLPIVDGNRKAGSGRKIGFPEFMVSQYQFFHYVDIAKKLHKHVVLMKARSVETCRLT